MMEKTEESQQKNRKMKRIIGLLIVVALIYVVATHFDLNDWPKLGLIIEGPKTTCTDIRGPKTMIDTVTAKLHVIDAGFSINSDERRATLLVKNADNTAGNVKVMLYCKNGDQQGEDKKMIDPDEIATFTFFDVADCDLDYIIEPEIIKKKVNKTVSVTDTICE